MAKELFIQASGAAHYDEVRKLFREYSKTLGFDLSFQDFEQELAGLPGEYAPPAGAIFLVICRKQAVGCAALRPIDPSTCEMKRMYIKPEFRGKGLGRRLAEAVIAHARQLEYQRMRLDTISFMKEAIALYRSLGFREIPAYRFNPISGALYLELNLK